MVRRQSGARTLTPGAIALGCLATTLLIAVGLAVRAGGASTLEQWSAGGRGFGAVLVFVLLAGESYTTFTFLGGSGWAYGRGAPAFYILAYPTIAYIASYWLLPAIWRRGTEWRVLSQPEFFARAYDSVLLGRLVAVVGVAALIAYLVLQLKGLAIIVQEASYGAISGTAAVWIGMLVVVAYVIVSGVRGSALTAAFKDVLVLMAAVGLGIALPTSLFGGIGAMFDRLIAERPGFLLLDDTGLSRTWYLSTTLLTALGFYLWPHTFGSLFTARHAGVFRRNAVLMPMYQVVLLFVFFVGFSAALAMPGLTGSDVDLALLRITRQTYGPWVMGAVGAAGMLTALVPASIILMAIATMVSRLVRPRATGAAEAESGTADPDDSATMARWLVPAFGAIALLFTFRGGTTIVALLLMAYSLVTQLAPALLAALWLPGRVSAAGAIAGIVAGELVVAVTTIANVDLTTFFPDAPAPLAQINTGVYALLVNVVTMLAVSAATRPSDQATARGKPRVSSSASATQTR